MPVGYTFYNFMNDLNLADMTNSKVEVLSLSDGYHSAGAKDFFAQAERYEYFLK